MLAVKISSNIRVNEGGAIRLMGLKNASIIERIQNKTKKILKADAPVKSGKFRSSITIIESKRRQSGGIFQGFAKVGPTVPYSKFVVRRTKPSIGAYVPSLGVRIKTGRHPGTPANKFIARSIPKIRQAAQVIVNNHYGAGKFDIVRFIKRG